MMYRVDMCNNFESDDIHLVFRGICGQSPCPKWFPWGACCQYQRDGASLQEDTSADLQRTEEFRAQYRYHCISARKEEGNVLESVNQIQTYKQYDTLTVEHQFQAY